MNEKKVISDISKSFFEGKKVFVRVDFNVPIDNKTNSIREDYRIRRAISTIDYLLDCGAKIILGSHLGRPKGRRVNELSLEIVANRLSQLLDRKVIFCRDFIEDKLAEKIDLFPNKSVVMLENLRFYKEETDNDANFSRRLAELADIYVNEAFSTSHRTHSSTYGMALDFDTKLAGFLVDKELKFISKMLKEPEHPFIV
ncbi:MAG TPA: phosphoglycerate kinase, partial [Candidatus Dadabacteria bacterium]|nr:phosphoglycerate kinase [Candidatus Dadabacteria bacterium]